MVPARKESTCYVFISLDFNCNDVDIKFKCCLEVQYNLIIIDSKRQKIMNEGIFVDGF